MVTTYDQGGSTPEEVDYILVAYPLFNVPSIVRYVNLYWNLSTYNWAKNTHCRQYSGKSFGNEGQLPGVEYKGRWHFPGTPGANFEKQAEKS